MKKLYFCDQCNKILPKGEIICDRCGFENTQIIPELSEDLLRDERKRKKLRKLAVVGVLILLFVADNFIFPPAWWRFERQADKNAIVDYVSRYYPKNTKRVGFSFPLQFPAAPHQASAIYYELDGIKFYVAAEKGRIVEDTYMRKRAEKQFDEIIIDGFFDPKGLSPGIDYWFKKEDFIYPYTVYNGHVSVLVREMGNSPRELGWLYDFYKYWKQECEFLKSYSVELCVVAHYDETLIEEYSLTFHKADEFTEDRFYSAFRFKSIKY